jgi:hypothetical protein
LPLVLLVGGDPVVAGGPPLQPKSVSPTPAVSRTPMQRMKTSFERMCIFAVDRREGQGGEDPLTLGFRPLRTREQKIDAHPVDGEPAKVGVANGHAAQIDIGECGVAQIGVLDARAAKVEIEPATGTRVGVGDPHTGEGHVIEARAGEIDVEELGAPESLVLVSQSRHATEGIIRRMRAAPPEFEDLLTPRGRRVLAGTHPLCGALAEPCRKFVCATGLVDLGKAAKLRNALDRKLLAHLSPMSHPIPPQTFTEMKHNYDEWLPKTARVSTAYLDHPRQRAYRVAQDLGVVDLLRSKSLRAFAAAVTGRILRKRNGMQVLCYRPGDYAGPHNDHHPEDAEARNGYTDLHLTLCTDAVAQQLLVYARRGHFSEVANVANLGGITIYRLPFWHYTTPLCAKRGREEQARRWVLLGTFLDA